jgi:hypothetical protein
MPQAQPELKKVRFNPPRQYTRFSDQRRVRREENREPNGKKKAWTEMILQYLDKRLFVQLNGSRKVIGVLRGYDVSISPMYVQEDKTNRYITGFPEHCSR